MADRHTGQLLRVLDAAQAEAGQCGAGRVGTRHMLLGLRHETEGAAARALDSLGISLAAARRQVHDAGPGPDQAQDTGEGMGAGQGADRDQAPGAPDEPLPYTPRAAIVLDMALREALHRGDNHIGTEHLLIALAAERDSTAGRALAALGAGPAQIRRLVLPWREAASPKTVRFVVLPPAALAALRDGHLAEASDAAGVALTPYFVSERARWLWRLRADQVAADPESGRWIARAAVAEPEGVVVGHAGFHGPPDADGMVEVGYSVDPAWRRRGYATAMVRELLRRAASEPRVRTVRATISPDNAASLATIAGFGFTGNGEQWDEEDGLELIFEHPA